ncbi:MAG: hypothetical protein AAF081_19970 [Actinomycetota bacterium]
MHNTPVRRFALVLVAALSMFAAACSGGDNDNESTANAVTDDAAATTDESSADSDDMADDSSGDDSGDDDSGDDDSGDDDSGDDELADEATSEPVRPTREELCDIIFGNVVQLTAYAGIIEYVDEPGAVLGNDCAIESTSVGYVSLSLIPALEPDLQTAAEGFDGTIVTTGATDSILLIEDPTGIAHVALIDEGGVIYQLQVSSDAATTSIDAVVEAALSTQVSIRNR